MATVTKEAKIVEKKIGNKILQMPDIHKLPDYYSTFPLYDRALPRVCKQIEQVDGYLSVVDIGANIGDTVSLITDEVQGAFLCVDGDEEYLPFLKENTARIKGSQITIEESYCSAGEKGKNFKVERFDGTAKLTISEQASVKNSPRFKTLDEIISRNSLFETANVLKIDTDGFEISVLEGAERYLQNAKPVIYFEFVPQLYKNNGHDPLYIFNLLRQKGYREALFYDNFGVPIGFVKLNDKKRIEELISFIDDNKIFYYDILTWHHSKRRKYKKRFASELMVVKNEV
jgi:FkbM family methyltransferase